MDIVLMQYIIIIIIQNINIIVNIAVNIAVVTATIHIFVTFIYSLQFTDYSEPVFTMRSWNILLVNFTEFLSTVSIIDHISSFMIIKYFIFWLHLFIQLFILLIIIIKTLDLGLDIIVLLRYPELSLLLNRFRYFMFIPGLRNPINCFLLLLSNIINFFFPTSDILIHL